MEYGSKGFIGNIYDYGIQRNSVANLSKTHYYDYDGRGSVSEIITENARAVMQYSYTAFGESIVRYNGYVKNPYRYNAEYVDWVPGIPDFQYLRARYYTPYEGRFINQDTLFGEMNIPLTQNLYLYVINNAVNMKDPSGRSLEIITGLEKSRANINSEIQSLLKSMSQVQGMAKMEIQSMIDKKRTSVSELDSQIRYQKGQETIGDYSKRNAYISGKIKSSGLESYSGLCGKEEVYIFSPGNAPKNEIKDIAIENVRDLLDSAFSESFIKWNGEKDYFNRYAISRKYEEDITSKSLTDDLTIVLGIINYAMLGYRLCNAYSDTVATYYDKNQALSETIYDILSPEPSLADIPESLGIPQKREREVTALKMVLDSIEISEKRYVISIGGSKWNSRLENIKHDIIFDEDNPFEDRRDFAAYRLYQIQYIDSIIYMNKNYTSTYQQTLKDYKEILEELK